mgnify:CR=1 FL=1
MQITIEKTTGGYRLESMLHLATPLPELFLFFADAGNLEELTPPWLNFTIETPAPIEMQAGALIDYRLKVRGLPLRWQTEITAWEPPYRFQDEQKKGPYRLWRHEHLFRETAAGTMALDIVDYALPGGALATPVHALVVGPDVRKIFEYRQQRLLQRFGQAKLEAHVA